MKALERIREIEELMDHVPDYKFMCKAFRIMKNIAIEVTHVKLNPHQVDESFWSKLESTVNEAFEERMKDEEKD